MEKNLFIMKAINNFFLFLVATLTIVCSSCSNDASLITESPNTEVVTRNVGVKTPTLTAYVETNDVNPLNAGEYYFTGTNPQEQVIERLILFASNIRGTSSTVELYHNNNQSYILNHASTLIAPLQAKGIKVMLGLLGDHTGIGFANLTDTQIDDFALAIKNCINTYGLDGVDFDDEYAEYGKISGTPSPSGAIYGKLIQKVRELLPDKLITAFDYGYTDFDQATLDALDYMWPNFGCNANPPSGLPNSKWAKLSMHYTDYYPSQIVVQNCANSYNGSGAIMSFNLRETNCSTRMNWFSSRVWGGKTVSWTGTVHLKNY